MLNFNFYQHLTVAFRICSIEQTPLNHFQSPLINTLGGMIALSLSSSSCFIKVVKRLSSFCEDVSSILVPVCHVLRQAFENHTKKRAGDCVHKCKHLRTYTNKHTQKNRC